MGFERVIAKEMGRPSYHPAVLLKLYIYGYLNRVQSSRRLEREACRNVEVMWLIGRLKRLRNVVAEMALHVLAYNLTRLMNILGKPGLIAAIRAA